MKLPRLYEQENIQEKFVYRIYYGYHKGQESLYFVLEGDNEVFFTWGGRFDEVDFAEYSYMNIKILKNPFVFDEIKLKNPLKLNEVKYLIEDLSAWHDFRDTKLIDCL